MIKVYSKIKLSEELKKKVLTYTNSISKDNKYILDDLKFEIDKNIISGVRIDINSEIFDLTLNNRLEKIFELLK